MELRNLKRQVRQYFIHVQFGVGHLVHAASQSLEPACLGQTGRSRRIQAQRMQLTGTVWRVPFELAQKLFD